jgi:hypothetical protein
MTFGASLKAPPALMKNGKNESGQLGLKLDVQADKGPLICDPPWVPRSSLPGTYLLATIMQRVHRGLFQEST